MRKRDLALMEGWLSMVVNVLLFVLKYWAGFVSGSVALVADAWHTLSDSFSSAIVVIAALVARKPADQKHPFGHGQAELIASIIIGVLLAIIGFEFILQAIERFQERQGAKYGTIAIIVTVVSILAKEGLAQYAIWAGEKTENQAVKADAWHHRTDAFSSLIILVGILAGRTIWWIDGALSIVVALLIFYASYEILRDSVNRIMGTDPGEELKKEIQQLADSVTSTKIHLHHIHLHDYGHHKEMTCHICLPGEMTIEESHAYACRIEDAVLEKFSIFLTIHVEPRETSCRDV
ncbi:MAG: cation transporter [Bacteroidia bacterium]|nr:cation diffusion facilitator family transporter [Bacteroidales bacterium]MDD3010390.1 cation diffusion facilitator family transporter [Bacteroidales bacterium]MDD3961250.1 cation diffusion facilitator family transporter [Bacteroidales bacterium]MDY0285623.1 cation diffusion facilitator family transporter [Bacteroidales bacterium]NCD41049.1 cation transporter [Bacteroidia bacterium]